MQSPITRNLITKKDKGRRRFISKLSSGTLALAATNSVPAFGTILSRRNGQLAILGGTPVRKAGRIGPSWPYIDERMVKAMINKTVANES